MDEVTPRALGSDAEARRAFQLDDLAAILPMERRDRLAVLLTDADVATLKDLVQEGMGENSLRALASDLAYLEAWALAATARRCPGQPPRASRYRIGERGIAAASPTRDHDIEARLDGIADGLELALGQHAGAYILLQGDELGGSLADREARRLDDGRQKALEPMPSNWQLS